MTVRVETEARNRGGRVKGLKSSTDKQLSKKPHRYKSLPPPSPEQKGSCKETAVYEREKGEMMLRGSNTMQDAGTRGS